jgi:hypothetical protein
MKKIIIISFSTLILFLIGCMPIYASDPQYGWINGVPTYTDNTNQAWINGTPYFRYNGAMFVPQIMFW